MVGEIHPLADPPIFRRVVEIHSLHDMKMNYEAVRNEFGCVFNPVLGRFMERKLPSDRIIEIYRQSDIDNLIWTWQQVSIGVRMIEQYMIKRTLSPEEEAVWRLTRKAQR